MAVLVVDILELVEVDHENVADSLITARFVGFTDDILFELVPVVQTGQVIDRDLVMERNDIDVKDHESGRKAEYRSPEPESLDDAEYRDDHRIDGAGQVLCPDGVVFAPESPDHRSDTA